MGSFAYIKPNSQLDTCRDAQMSENLFQLLLNVFKNICGVLFCLSLNLYEVLPGNILAFLRQMYYQCLVVHYCYG